MKNKSMLAWCVAAAIAIGIIGVRYAQAATSQTAQYAKLQRVDPSPMAPKHPTKIALSGVASVCAQIATGAVVRTSCTVDCQYDAATKLADGGYLITDYGDGGGITGATADSNQLPTAVVETFALAGTQDSVCVYSTDAGSAYVAARYP